MPSSSGISSYLSQILDAANLGQPFDAARYLDIVARNAAGQRDYINNAAAGYQAAHNARGAEYMTSVAPILDQIDQTDASIQQNLERGAAEFGGESQSAAAMNEVFAQNTLGPAQSQFADTLNAAAAEQHAMSGVNATINQNRALDEVDSVNSQAAYEINKIAAEEAAAAAEGGGGGGGGGGGYGGGGGGGGGGSDDELTSGDRARYGRLLEFEAEGTLGDYKNQVISKFGGRGAPIDKRRDLREKGKKTVQRESFGENFWNDLLEGRPGGVSGRLAEDFSNAGEITRNALAWWDNAQKKGRKTGISRGTIKDVGKFLGKIQHLPQADLKKLTEDYNVIDLLDIGPELLEGMPLPREIAAEEAADASASEAAAEKQRRALIEEGKRMKAWEDKQKANEKFLKDTRLKQKQKENLLRAHAFNLDMQKAGKKRRRRGYAGKRPGPG